MAADVCRLRRHIPRQTMLDAQRPLPDFAHRGVIGHVRQVSASLAVVGGGILVWPDDIGQVSAGTRKQYYWRRSRIGGDPPGASAAEADRGTIDVHAP